MCLADLDGVFFNGSVKSICAILNCINCYLCSLKSTCTNQDSRHSAYEDTLPERKHLIPIVFIITLYRC